MKKIAFTFLLPVILWAQPEIGKLSPPLHVTEFILNEPDDKSIQGNFLVLDFWATWCGPCIQSVPHFNDLVEEFSDRGDVMFMSLSDESREKIERTLKRIEFKSVVATDVTRQSLRNFKVEGIPATFVIDPDGIIRWMGHPNRLKIKDLEDIFGPDPTPDMLRPEYKPELMQQPVSFMNALKDSEIKKRYIIGKADPGSALKVSVLQSGIPGHFDNNVSLIDIFGIGLGVPAGRINLAKNVEVDNFSFFYLNKQVSLEEARKEIISGMEDLFQLTHEVSRRTVPAFAGSITDSTLMEPTLSEQASVSDAGEKVIYTAQTIDEVFSDLEERTNTPYLWQGEDKTQFDFIIDISTSDSIRSSFESYGIQLQEQPVQVEYITIKKNE